MYYLRHLGGCDHIKLDKLYKEIVYYRTHSDCMKLEGAGTIVDVHQSMEPDHMGPINSFNTPSGPHLEPSDRLRMLRPRRGRPPPPPFAMPPQPMAPSPAT